MGQVSGFDLFLMLDGCIGYGRHGSILEHASFLVAFVLLGGGVRYFNVSDTLKNLMPCAGISFARSTGFLQLGYLCFDEFFYVCHVC